MPKVVDHEQRRELIADAVCRLAARQGLEEVSLRHVAAEAGVSVGQIQHYFGTKDEMLLFAFRTVSARVEQRLGLSDADGSTRGLVWTLARAMMPTDAESRFEAPLWIAFMARAVVRPDLAVPLRDGGTQLLAFVADRLRAAQDAGEVPASLDAEHEASALFALADGLALRAVLDPSTVEAALATLDYHLDRIFPGG